MAAIGEDADSGCDVRREPGGFVLIGTVLQREILAALARRGGSDAAEPPGASVPRSAGG